MPKYYCDYCDTFLTHDSPSVRKTHNGGRKHKENVRMYYQGWMEQQAQKLVDATARAFKAGTLQPSMPRMMSQPGLRPGMYPTMPYAMHPAMMMQRPPLPTGAFPRPPMPMQ